MMAACFSSGSYTVDKDVVTEFLQYAGNGYQKYLGEKNVITKHYAKHPALMAFGIDNESGDAPISIAPFEPEFIELK